MYFNTSLESGVLVSSVNKVLDIISVRNSSVSLALTDPLSCYFSLSLFWVALQNLWLQAL